MTEEKKQYPDLPYQTTDDMELYTNIEEITPDDTIQVLYNKKDIELKSEVHNPHAITGLKTISNRALQLGLLKCHNTLKTYIQDFLEIMVSNLREGRKEYVDMTKSINFEQPQTLAQKQEEKEK